MLHFILLLLFINFPFRNAQKKQNIGRNCVPASDRLFQMGDGSTPTSCMSCNPALPTCYGICQVLIDQYYLFCDDVCLPEGYYFDPGSKLKGCWNDVKHQIKIDVERCGCNASSRKYSSISLMFALLVAGLFFGLLG